MLFTVQPSIDTHKKKVITLENSGFENAKLNPWKKTETGSGTGILRASETTGCAFGVRLPDDYPQALVSLQHRQIADLPLEPGRIYKLGFFLCGTQLSPTEKSTERGRVPAYGVRVRIIYRNSNDSDNSKNRAYDWLSFKVVEAGRQEAVVFLSPENGFYTRADVTFFFERKGEYQLDSVTLEQWNTQPLPDE